MKVVPLFNAAFFLSVLLFMSENVAADNKKDCKVSSFSTQQDFNISAYMGRWYVISDNGFFPFQHLFDKLFYTVQDAKGFYILEENGDVTALTAAYEQIQFGCAKSAGTIKTPDPKEPAKMEISFPDAWLPFARAANPYWVMATDYSYAVIYSCRGLLEDGTYNPKHTYVFTLNRNKEGHSEGEQRTINATIRAFCLEPTDLKPMPRVKECPELDPNKDYPEHLGEEKKSEL